MAIAVLGSGSWGTALALLLGRNGHEVLQMGRDEDEIASIRSLRENLRYLPGFALPETVHAQMLHEPTENIEAWIVAVPANAVGSVLSRVHGEAPLVVVASKGLEPATGDLLSRVVTQHVPNAVVGAISGPNLAVELARGIPTAAVAACPDETVAERIALLFNCRTFRAYVSDDRTGVELAGALKNVLALSAGMSDGLGFGDNTKGALVARGLYEITKLGTAMGAKLETFFGIAGVGDLFATANSTLSRNYRVGRYLGEGLGLEAALERVGQVAEGVPTAHAAVVLARKHGVPVPIMESTEAVVRGRMAARDAVSQLMERMPKREGLHLLAEARADCE